MDEYKLPLGVLKQISLKLDSVLDDIGEVLDSNIDTDDKYRFEQMKDVTREMLSAVYMTVQKEMDEEEFKNECIEMDEMENPFDEEFEI